MSPTWAQATVAGVVAIAAALNYFVLLSINAKIADMRTTMHEWARNTFAQKADVDRLEQRFKEITEAAAVAAAAVLQTAHERAARRS